MFPAFYCPSTFHCPSAFLHPLYIPYHFCHCTGSDDWQRNWQKNETRGLNAAYLAITCALQCLGLPPFPSARYLNVLPLVLQHNYHHAERVCAWRLWRFIWDNMPSYQLALLKVRLYHLIRDALRACLMSPRNISNMLCNSIGNYVLIHSIFITATKIVSSSAAT